ncbi:MAG: TM2 domain-containing protein [Bacilli bacterium]|nr:TM2 domain-containing protein [Bacilli bacterium]
MSQEKKKELLIVLFGGLFGIHKFIKGNFKWGIIYLFTAGLFGIGWIIDIIITVTDSVSVQKKSLMGTEGINAINNGQLPNIQGTNLNLAVDETCCYVDKAYTFKDKIITTGYTGKSSGVNIRIMKGLSYRTGGGNSQAIRQNQRTTYNGILYITTRRIIYTSQNESFDKTFDKITSVQETSNGIVIQIGSHTYTIITETHSEFMKVFKLVKQF